MGRSGRLVAAALALGALAGGDHAAGARVAWRPSAPGVEVAEARLDAEGSAWRFRVALARLDPAVVALRLDANVERGRSGPWTVDRAPAEALLAVNAGQFTDGGPWGWVVHRGREHQRPGTGPLAMAVVTDSAGGVRLVEAGELDAVRAAGGVAEAFQSYPALLMGDGEVPTQLQAAGRGVDLGHRDARLALCQQPDGRLIVALTRLDAPGSDRLALPVGPTVPEMAALMLRLGCRRALLLDGGLSGQLLVRDSTGEARRWPGLRSVPLGLVAVRR